jgi:uncharacterized protein
MQKFFSSDLFALQRPSFMANTLYLIAIMLLYPLVGGVLLSFVSGGSGAAFSLSTIERSQLSSIRLIQAMGQILVLALPVLLLAGWHTGRKNPFAPQSLAFLGIGKPIDFGMAALAVGGIFLLQPLLYTITAAQDNYLWPALGSAGAEVVRQRDLMESFIRQLAQAGSVSEYLSVAVVFAVTPALCEELFFRGYIQQNYSRSISSGNAVVLTGFIFALFHLSAANLLPLALLGWYIGYIYASAGNLAISFLVHFVNNLAALLFLFVTEGGNLECPVESKALLGAPWWWLVVAGSILLFIMVLRRLLAVLQR